MKRMVRSLRSFQFVLVFPGIWIALLLAAYNLTVTQANASVVQGAVYLGIESYGTVTSEEKADFVHRFFVDGEVQTWQVQYDDTYSVQNQLMEGYLYDLTLENSVITAVTLLDTDNSRLIMGSVEAIRNDSITINGNSLTVSDGTGTYAITSDAGGATVAAASIAVGDPVNVVVSGSTAVTIYKSFVADAYEAPVSGTPGETTLKNFLATALEPVGTTLYIYGGAWDWQDEGAGLQATTIELPQSWIDFFQAQDSSYSYKNSSDAAHSYYPHNAWNQYYYAGADCSGYVGWVLYNVVNTESGGEGYVSYAVNMAKGLSERGWGQWTHAMSGGFSVGDVCSLSGHVWICLGTCEDGSIVFLHSTPSISNTGAAGGGVQISALNPAGTTDCEAYQLANYYMRTYYPAWSQRYTVSLCNYASYTAVSANENAGKFTWDLTGSGLLTDPDGYANMTPAEILKDLFAAS